MTRKQFTPLLGQMLKKIAPRIGAKVLIEPEWGIVGQITFRNGRKRYFRYSSLDLNPLGASEIASDKDYAAFFLNQLGYSTVPGKTFFSPDWAKAIGSRQSLDAADRYARQLGFPIFVKPNHGSQGSNVWLVNNRADLSRALRLIFKQDRVALIQKPVSGKDYRVVVLDRQVISAYERLPLNVVGDGQSNILKLLREKQRHFVASSRDTRLKLTDPRIQTKLKRQKLNLRSIPTKGECVYLLDNANLSSGGDAIDVTKQVHPAFKQLAIKATRDMGLRFCGIDLIIDGDISQPPAKYWILEINAAPGLDHYANSGRAQNKIVEDLYLQVLKNMAH